MSNIHFKTTDKKVSFEEGTDTNLLRASIRYEGGVPYKCGGGLCGTCKVFVEEGAENLTDIKKHEVARLGGLTQQGYRLACQTFAKGDCQVSWDAEVKTKTNEKLKEYWEKSS
jgi:ferredoxin